MSFCFTTNGTIIKTVLRLSPNPQPMMTWNPYWAAGTARLDESRELNRPTPRVCRLQPASSTYRGGSLRLDSNRLANTVATGERRRSGNMRMPASTAVVPLTTWKR